MAAAGTGTPGFTSHRRSRGQAPDASCTTTAADTIRSLSTSVPVVSVSKAANGPSYQPAIRTNSSPAHAG